MNHAPVFVHTRDIMQGHVYTAQCVTMLSDSDLMYRNIIYSIIEIIYFSSTPRLRSDNIVANSLQYTSCVS